jgi:hypothetical protein
MSVVYESMWIMEEIGIKITKNSFPSRLNINMYLINHYVEKALKPLFYAYFRA